MMSKRRLKGLGSELRLMIKRARQVWRLVPGRRKGALGAAAFIMALISLCNTSVPLLLGKLVDEVKIGTEQGSTHNDLYRLAAWFLSLIGLAYLLREGLNVLRRYLVDNAYASINRHMSVKLMAHMMKVDLATLSKTKVGALHGRIYRSVEGLVRFLRLLFLDFIPALLTGLFALAAATMKQPVLGLIMAGVMPTAVILTFRQLLSQKGVRLRLLRSHEAIDGAVVEQLSGLEYVRAANTHPLEIRRLARATEKHRIKEVYHLFTMSCFGCAKALNEGFFHILVLAGATYCAIAGIITLGDVLTFSILFVSVMTPLSEVHRILDEGHENSLRVGDLLNLLAEPVDQSFHTVAQQQPKLQPGRPVLVAENLQVEYAANDGKPVRALDGIALSIRHGETIGLAGRSGSGKSTLLKVLLRLTHPCGGTIRFGGAPLEDVSRLIGYVGQSPFVFAGTIAENIAYGTDNPSPESIRRAAQAAHLHDEILLMPDAYETLVNERGQNLSGGQRQRLALARILLKQPPVLILDEATSALDNISERHVQRQLGLTNTDRTTILVAHRLSTLRDADRIFVFDSGRIVETGTFDELLLRGGVFAELVRSAEQGVKENGKPSPSRPQPQPWLTIPPQVVPQFAPVNHVSFGR